MAWRSGTGAATASATVGWTSSVPGAAKPSVAAASTNPAAMFGNMLCARRQFERTPDDWA